MPSPIARGNASSILSKQFFAGASSFSHTTLAHILALQQRVPHQPKVFWSNTGSENEVQMFSPIPITSFRSINSSSSSNSKTTSPPEISPEDLLLLIQRAVGHEISNNNNNNVTATNFSSSACDWRRAISILTKAINYCGVIPSWKCYELTLKAACDSRDVNNNNPKKQSYNNNNNEEHVPMKGSWAAALSCTCALSYSAESLGSFSRIVLPMLLMVNQQKVEVKNKLHLDDNDDNEVAKRGVEESFKFLNAILINNSKSNLQNVSQLVDNVGVRKVLQQTLLLQFQNRSPSSSSSSSSWFSALSLFPHLWSAGALDTTNVELLLKIVVKAANSNHENKNMWLSAIRLAWLHTSPMKTALSPATVQDLMKLLLLTSTSGMARNANWMIALQVATRNNSLAGAAASSTSSDESNEKMIVALALAESSTFSKTVAMKFCLKQLKKQQLSESFFDLTNKILLLQENKQSSSGADFSIKWIDSFVTSKNSAIFSNSATTSSFIPSFCRTLLIMKCQLRCEQLSIQASVSHCLKKTILDKKTITCESNNFNDVLLAVVLTCAEFVARGSKLDEAKFIPIEQISNKVVEEFMKAPFLAQHLHRKIRIGGKENLGSSLQISHFFPSCVPGFSLLEDFVFGKGNNHNNNGKNEEAAKIVMNISPSEILILSLISYSARYSPPGGFASDASYLMKRFHKSFAASHRLRCALLFVWCTTMNAPDEKKQNNDVEAATSYSQQLSKIAFDIFELEIENEHHQRQQPQQHHQQGNNNSKQHHTILNLFSLVAKSLRPLHSSEAVKSTVERRTRFELFSSAILSIGSSKNENSSQNFKITNSLKWISFAPNSTSKMRQVFCHELPMTATLHHLPYQDFGEKFCSFALAPSPKNKFISMNFYIDAAVACGEIVEAWKCHRMKLGELSSISENSFSSGEESNLRGNNKHTKLFAIMDQVFCVDRQEKENNAEMKKLELEGLLRKIQEFCCDASTSDALKISVVNLILCQEKKSENIFFNSSSAYLFPYRSCRKMFQLIQEILSSMSPSSLHSSVTSIHHRDSEFLKYFVDLTVQNLLGIGLSYPSRYAQNDQHVSGIPTKSFMAVFSEVAKCFENLEKRDSSQNILNSILGSIFSLSLEKISIARKKALSYEIHNINERDNYKKDNNSDENQQQVESISSSSSSDYLMELEKLLVRFYMSWFVSSYSKLVLNSNQNNQNNYFFSKVKREKLEKPQDDSFTTSNDFILLESKDQLLLLATKLSNYLATRFISQNSIADNEAETDDNNTLVASNLFVFQNFALIDSASIWLSTVPTLLEYTLHQISLHNQDKQMLHKLQNLTSSLLQTLLHGGDSIFCQLAKNSQSLTVFVTNQQNSNNTTSRELYKILLRKIDRILLRSSKLYKNILQSSQFSNLASKQRRDALNFLLDSKEQEQSITNGREFLIQLFENWSRLANNNEAHQTISSSNTSNDKTIIVTLLRSQKALLAVGGNLSSKHQHEKDFQDLWDSLIESKFNILVKMSSSTRKRLNGHVPSTTTIIPKQQKLLSDILYETNVPIDANKSSGRGTRSLLTTFQASRVLHLMKMSPHSSSINNSENDAESWKPAFDALCWVSNSFHNKEAIMTASIESCSNHLARCGRIVECCKMLEMFVLNNNRHSNSNNEEDVEYHDKFVTNSSTSKIQKERCTIFLGDIMTALAKFQSRPKSAEETDSTATMLEALETLRNFSRQSLDSQIAFAVRALENDFAGSIKFGSGGSLLSASQNLGRNANIALPPSEFLASPLQQKQEVLMTENQKSNPKHLPHPRSTKLSKQHFDSASQNIVWTTQRKNALLPYLDYLTKNAPATLPDDRRTTNEAHRKKFLADIKPFEYVVANAFAKKDAEGDDENAAHNQQQKQQILPMQLAWLWYRHEGRNRQHLFRLKETYDRVEDAIYQIFGKLSERTKTRDDDNNIHKDKTMTRNKIVAKELIGAQLDVIEKLEYLSRRVGMKLKNVSTADEGMKLLLLQQEAILNEKWTKFFDEKCPLLKGTKCEGQLRACRMLINVLKPNLLEADDKPNTLNRTVAFKKAEADLEKVAKNYVRTVDHEKAEPKNTEKKYQSSSALGSFAVAENLLHQALRLKQQNKNGGANDYFERVLVEFGQLLHKTNDGWLQALSSIDKVVSKGENVQKLTSANTKQQIVESWWRMALKGMK